jgi:hypothetical protein
LIHTGQSYGAAPAGLHCRWNFAIDAIFGFEVELVQLAVTSALPGFIAKKMILKKMRETVTELLDRHCGSVRYDLLNRLANTVLDFQRALNEKIDMTLEGIRISFQKALTLHQSSKVDVEKNLSELFMRLVSISSLRDELLAMSAAVG